jgi:hypothetical protein
MSLNEDKKTFLLELVNTLQEEISVLASHMETNYDIKDEDWDQYELAFQGLHQMLDSLKDEVYYT